jgi:ATP-dependent DNA helicase RecG
METTDMTQQTLEAIIQAGESYQVEFKRNVNSDISKEVVAFANSSGGRIFVGIDDDGTIPGIALTNELKARVQTMARDCDPPVDGTGRFQQSPYYPCSGRNE